MSILDNPTDNSHSTRLSNTDSNILNSSNSISSNNNTDMKIKDTTDPTTGKEAETEGSNITESSTTTSLVSIKPEENTSPESNTTTEKTTNSNRITNTASNRPTREESSMRKRGMNTNTNNIMRASIISIPIMRNIIFGTSSTPRLEM